MTPQETPARWYMVNSHGMATLCADEADARAEALLADRLFTSGRPHRAALLGDVAAEREACAQICDHFAKALDYSKKEYLRSTEAQQAAKRIRARGTP